MNDKFLNTSSPPVEKLLIRLLKINKEIKKDSLAQDYHLECVKSHLKRFEHRDSIPCIIDINAHDLLAYRFPLVLEKMTSHQRLLGNFTV